MNPTTFFRTTLFTLFLVPFSSPAAEFDWQKDQAKFVAPNDLQWQPEPFEFEAGETIRYVDYENGNDSASGDAPSAAWKHHPWDSRASGESKAFTDVATYIFKRGVSYRIEPGTRNPAWIADDSGTKEEPIRLTSSPEWGEGEAIIAGAIPINGEWKKAVAADVPERMDVQDQTVWYLDLEAPDYPGKPGKMEVVPYEITPDGEIRNLYLASDVGWQLQNSNFALHHWNTWDEYRKAAKEGPPYQDDALKGFESDYFEGGTVWSQYAWVIANPTADDDPIGPGDYDPERGTLRFKKGQEPVNPGTRYLVENLPQFLDQPGEYYYDTEMARLFVRLEEDRDPNESQIEMGTGLEVLRIEDQSHIEVSGLTFRFNGRRKGMFFEESHVIVAEGNIEQLGIHHCKFEFIGNDAIKISNNSNERMGEISLTDCDFHWINGGTGLDMTAHTGKDVDIPKDGQPGRIDEVNILRNRLRNMGLYRHDDHRWSNVPALGCSFATELHMAGNIIDSTWGSGLFAQGGLGGKGIRGFDFPLSRLLIHHNKTENNALAVNDYGGLSIWQHGPTYAYNNIVGNSVGFWPGGFFNRGDGGLSYPIYLDAGFKVSVFNNITWARPYSPDEPYSSDTPAFFNVFGFMNPFVNNTILGNGDGIGGTSGNRNDYLGNLFARVNQKFISVNHGGNPSLIGGDDDASSGIDGASTLAYGYNLFQGKAEAGVVATIKRGAKKNVEAKTIAELQQQMEAYPMRFAQLGTHTDEFPLMAGFPEASEKPTIAEMDLRPQPNTAAIGRGVKYFVPWGLYGTVGEWYFDANHADPDLVLDFHYYPSVAHFNRSMYHRVPGFELEVSEAELDDYVRAPTSNWSAGALIFDGKRYASTPDKAMKADLVLKKTSLQSKSIEGRLPPEPWREAGATLVLPASERNTPSIATSNLLVEIIVRIEEGATDLPLMGKFDGKSGYRLAIDTTGHAVFEIASNGESSVVQSKDTVNNGEWVHLLAEVDRRTGDMTLYRDGKTVRSAKSELDSNASLVNAADLLVGTNHDKSKFLRGAVDFLRISTGTLADANTSIEELDAWQFDGPVLRDFAGRQPEGKRDIGALQAE